MIRIAFTLIGGKNWTGGHNYLLNLLRALSTYQNTAVVPVLFVPLEQDVDVDAFVALSGVEVVRSELFNADRRQMQLIQALLWGRVSALTQLFCQHRIDVVFEAAQFFGWRLGLPAIAWIPDFQHKALPHLFSRTAWLKRELGFRAQIMGGRTIMLSSDDARRACERYYPATRGSTRTVHFAMPAGVAPDFPAARRVADSYGLPAEFIFMPNQFWRHKNHTLVLDALEILRTRGVNVVVVASGKQHDPRSPEHFSAFEHALKARKLDSSLCLIGLIPYAHLIALMRCCQAMLNPSLFEGWSTTVEEARSLATPMLLSDLDVHREQMGTSAQYFRRDSAEELANRLQSVSPFDAAARMIAVERAAGEADARIRRFAQTFASLAQEAAGAVVL